MPPDTVPAATVADAVIKLTDPGELTRLFDEVVSLQFPDLLERIGFEVEHTMATDVLKEDRARLALPVLIDSMDRLPSGRSVMERILPVTRVSFRMIKGLKDETIRERIVAEALQNAHSLSGKLALLRLVGHRENVGTGLIREHFAAGLESALRDEIAQSTPHQLASEIDMVGLSYVLVETNAQDALRNFATDDGFLTGLLGSAVSQSEAKEVEAAAVEVMSVLPWDMLVAWLGEEFLVQRVKVLHSKLGNSDDAVPDAQTIALAYRYAIGDPPQFPFGPGPQRGRDDVVDSADDASADDGGHR